MYTASKYIPTVTNFASIVVNCFLFSAEDNSSMAFRSKFWIEVYSSSFAKKVLNKSSKDGFVGHGLQRMLFLDTCVRRLETKNGEFEGSQ